MRAAEHALDEIPLLLEYDEALPQVLLLRLEHRYRRADLAGRIRRLARRLGVRAVPQRARGRGAVRQNQTAFGVTTVPAAAAAAAMFQHAR